MCRFTELDYLVKVQWMYNTVHIRITKVMCKFTYLRNINRIYKQSKHFMTSFMTKSVPAIFHFPSADSCMPQQPEK